MRKGKFPRLNSPPPRSRSWLKRQTSADGFLGAKSPEPAQLSLLREPGTQEAIGFQAP